MGVLVIPEGKSILFRIAIFIGLGTLVTTIIYLTPIPDQYPQSCSRPCHELDWPMICRVKLTLERYQTWGNSCKDCRVNSSACYHENCIAVNDEPQGILTANRQFPGPTIQVCQNDILVVDVVNRIPGQSFGVHWRGQSQVETPYMDGVPMITQCPISSLTTFQYKFRASESGTHLWQVNTGEENLDTLFGPLVVKKPDSKEIHRKLYDIDDLANVIVIHPWNPRKWHYLFSEDRSPVKLLINGKNPENNSPPSVFKITPKKRHRFRVLYVGGGSNCQIQILIENHQFLVISLDGHPIKPKMVTSIRLFPGERLDFVLPADQPIASYHMKVTPVESCQSLLPTSAVIQYRGASFPPKLDTINNNEILVRKPEFTELKMYGDDCRTTKNLANICLQDVHAVESIPEELLIETPIEKFYFFYNSSIVSQENTANSSFIALSDKIKVPQTNNITMMLPSSPLLSQSHQINSDDLCSSESIPERCSNNGSICECVHVVDIALNSIVELVLVNQDKDDHVFHLHGNSFRVVGTVKLPSHRLKPVELKQLDEMQMLVKRNLKFSVIKDTVAVLNNSAVVLRFKAKNPGYWLLEEENNSFWSRGMSVILHVGKKSDLTPIPKNFPTCGDWIGPEFFLV